MTNVYIFHQHFFLLQVQNVDHQIWKQTFLIVIVVVRWILPKGGLSHDELSNLLFIYFASASDIMELSSFEIFDTESAKLISQPHPMTHQMFEDYMSSWLQVIAS